jgi:uncharacterized YigZ family protein
MSLPGIIKTPKVSSENVYKEKGSEFIAAAFPVESESDVQIYLDEIRKKYYDASHHCYAFRLKDDSFRYSDAGEPNGTAGIRILNAIDHFEVKDILVIVTRYFGGVKLGVGPLGKAYYTSSELLLRKCQYQEERPVNKVIIECVFDYISHVHRELSTHSGVIDNINYGEPVRFVTFLPLENTENFERELTDASKGNIKIIREKGIIFYKI